MTPCFADTFYFFALFNSNDSVHNQALAFANQSRREFVTTTWNLTEMADGLAATRFRTMVAPFVRLLQSNPCAEIVPVSEDLFVRGMHLYDHLPDKAWSLTDCISFVVMGDRNLTDALTGDHHFIQAGFNALLR